MDNRDGRFASVQNLHLQSRVIPVEISRRKKQHNNMEQQTVLFTVADIKAAHSKVKSGADFPNYIKEIRQLGVTHYNSYLEDGHIDYYGKDNYLVTVPARYATLTITGECNIEAFKRDLRAHQQGKTDFLTFCTQCAMLGIEKWSICMDKMTCTYYNKSGNAVYVESIPE